ncbi:MAG: transcription elongation factor GreA [Clostridia bacterium]|nr:transcription elongation factor GreA [Clostridia bacterium]MBQ4207029.1 transcription elongation factor GreA [Clostridia bacterium]
MMEEATLTREALKEVQKKLEHLKSVGRKEAAEQLKVARSFGDLSENSEYDEAKTNQAKLEAEIQDLETLIARAKIIDVDNSTEVVHMNSIVTIKGTARGAAEKTFQICGYAQVDPSANKISEDSPLAKALTGHKVGDKVTVEAPRGEMTYKIVKIKVGK